MTTTSQHVITAHHDDAEEAEVERYVRALLSKARADLADVLSEEHDPPLLRIA